MVYPLLQKTDLQSVGFYEQRIRDKDSVVEEPCAGKLAKHGFEAEV